ncbi:MAG: archaemetzincin family Zn-dependent metalloprotease [Bacteroidales bacterium]|jgi:archaemetzincin
MNVQGIELISFGYFEVDFLGKIAIEVTREYTVPVHFKEGHLDLSEYYDAARRQYNGNLLLKEVDRLYGSDSLKTFGLFYVDLFIPILTYIFGQAFLGGRTGIVSIYRLSNERYGLKEIDDYLVDRFTKEVIHELGHTFGLIHCHVPDCVMGSSTYVEDIDQKSAHLCSNCRSNVGIM